MDKMISRIVVHEPSKEQLRNWRRARKHNYEGWLDNLNVTNMSMQRLADTVNNNGKMAPANMHVKVYMTKDAIVLLEIWGQGEDFKKVSQQEMYELTLALQLMWNDGSLMRGE